MIKKIVLLGILGLFVLISLALPDARVRTHVIRFTMTEFDGGDSINDRYARDTFELPWSMSHYAQGIDGRIIFDSTTYDTGAFGNADTVVLVLKSMFGEGALAKYYTLDSTLKVFAWGLGVNCTLNVTADTDSLGERLLLIWRVADTVNEGVDTVTGLPGDAINGTIRINILHNWLD